MGTAPPFPITSAPSAPGGNSSPSPPLLLWGQLKTWLLLAVQQTTEWHHLRPVTHFHPQGPSSASCALAHPPWEGALYKVTLSQGWGKEGEREAPPGVWLLSEMTQRMPWLGGTVCVTCPRVTETLTLLRTRVARVALGKNHPYGSDLHC